MAENSAPRPHKMASGDEFLDLLLTQSEHTNKLLGLILDRLPEPAPATAGEPGRIELREPQAPGQMPESPTGPVADEKPAEPPVAKVSPAKRVAKKTTPRGT